MSAPVIGPLIIASGLVVCSRPASTKPQLATGPQKCVVLGPVGELMNFMSADDIVVVGGAVGRDGAGDCGGATRLRPSVGNRPSFVVPRVNNSLVAHRPPSSSARMQSAPAARIRLFPPRCKAKFAVDETSKPRSNRRLAMNFIDEISFSNRSE